jgi:hypothetical protein
MTRRSTLAPRRFDEIDRLDHLAPKMELQRERPARERREIIQGVMVAFEIDTLSHRQRRAG